MKDAYESVGGRASRKTLLPREELVSATVLALESMRPAPRNRVVVLAGVPGSGRRTIAELAVGRIGSARSINFIGDLSRFDHESLHEAFLEYTTGSGVMLAVDDQTVSSEFSQRLLAEDALEVIQVGMLNQEEVFEFVSGFFSCPPSAKLMGELWKLSAGHFSVLNRLLNFGISRGVIQRESECALLLAAHLPPCAELLHENLLTVLSESEFESLRKLSLIEPAPRSLAEHLVGHREIDRLVDVGLVERVAAEGTQPPFLWIPIQAIAQVVRDTNPSLLASRLYEKVLFLPKSPQSGEYSALGRIRAIEWAQQNAVFDRGALTIQDVTDAARGANQLHDYVMADRLSSAGLQQFADQLSAEERIGLLREQAFARRFLGDPEASLSVLREAQTLAVEHGEGHIDAIGIATILHYERGDAKAAFEELDRAESQVFLAAHVEELAAERVSQLAYAGCLAESHELFGSLAQTSFSARSRAATSHAMVEAYLGSPDRALRRLYAYSAQPLQRSPTWFIEELLGALFVCLVHTHGPARARRSPALLGRQRSSPFLAVSDVAVMTARAGLASSEGRAAETLQIALSLAATDSADRSGFRHHALALGAEAAALLGSFALSARLEEDCNSTAERASAFFRPDTIAALTLAAHLRGENGALAHALARAEEFAESKIWGAAIRIARVGLRFGSVESAERILGWQDHVSGPVLEVFCSHADAVVTESPAAMNAVAEKYLQLGLALPAAEAFGQAAHFARLGNLSDQAQQREKQAQLIMGMLGELRPLHISTPAPATEALTPREQQISLLVAQRASNRDIAQALHLSVRTVEGHLGRIYAKLGMSGRRELARFGGTGN